MSMPNIEASHANIRQENANFRHLVAEIGWFGIALPGVGSFLSVYAIKLGADAIALGLLSSLPGIAMLAGTFITEWWANRHPDTRQALLLPAILMRLRILLIAAIPFLPPAWRIPALIGLMALFAPSIGLTNVVFTVLQQEAVTHRQFTAMVSRRQLVMNLSIAASTLFLGFWLERVAFPANYQSMYVVMFLATLVSLWHALRIRALPDEANTPAPAASAASPAKPSPSPWRMPAFRGMAIHIACIFVAYFAMWSVIPLRLVNDLGASEGFISIYSFLKLISAATMAVFASRIVNRFGHRNVMMVGMGIAGLAMTILALAPSLPLTLPAALIGGAAWATTDITQFSFFNHSFTEARTTAFSNAYFQSITVAIIIGPLIGSTLASSGIPLPPVLLFGAALRILAGWLMHNYRVPQTVMRTRKAPST